MNESHAENLKMPNVVPINSDFQSFKFFMEWSNKLQFTDDFADLHNMVLEAVQVKTPYKHSWIMVTDPDNSNEVYIISILGEHKESILENYPRLDLTSDPMLREIKDSHHPVIVEDARTDKRTNKEIVAVVGNVTIVNIPITLTGELVGVLAAGTFGDEDVAPPSQEDIDSLMLLSNYIGPVIVRILEQEKQIRYQTALEKAKFEAELGHQLKTEFIENVTHELRTPLHAINGFVQLLELESENFSEDQHSYLSDINSANARLLSLVENVLDFSNAESGTLKINHSDVDLIKLIHESITEHQPSIEKKCISITENFEDLVSTNIISDKKRLKQIIDNLISNAINFNRENGTILISAETDIDNSIKISIKDSGIGIPKEKFSTLFSPFSRINKNADTLGAGISLVVTKQLTELLGGELKYESVENTGSDFWLEIPSNNKL